MPEPLDNTGMLRVVTGCGTSYNLALSVAAAMNARGLQAVAVPGGEWVERPGAYVPEGVPVELIALSRSGETTETIRAAITSRRRGAHVIGITCAPGSALSKAASRAIEFETHPAEGIVMTASASLMLLAGLALAGHRIDAALRAGAQALMQGLDALDPGLYAGRSTHAFLGGGALYGAALEGALKLTEMALCHSQCFHPGEYRHGPISMVDDSTVALMLYHAQTADADAALVRDLQSKGAFVIGLGGPGDAALPALLPDDRACAQVLPALQLFGEKVARSRGIDTTAPRHLTKVVVLEGGS